VAYTIFLTSVLVVNYWPLFLTSAFFVRCRWWLLLSGRHRSFLQQFWFSNYLFSLRGAFFRFLLRCFDCFLNPCFELCFGV